MNLPAALATDDLALFCLVVETGTIGAAAPRIHLSQSAATRRLQRLERRVGVRLFERAGRRLALTERGREFHRRAIDVLDRLRDLQLEMDAFSRGQRGVLRIGATVTVCVYLLPPILETMRQEHPEYELFLSNDRSSRLRDLVREGAIDLGVGSVIDPGQSLEGLKVHLWRHLHLSLLTPAGERVEGCSIRSLDGAPLVASASGSLRVAVDRALARYGVRPRITAQADSLEAVRTLVACGFGRAVVPAEVMADDPSVCAHGFDEPIEPLQVACFYRRPQPPLRAFLELLNRSGFA